MSTEYRKSIREKVFYVLQLMIGNLFYAAAVKFFLIPSGLLTGGTTGIALAVNRFIKIDIPTFVLMFNVVMLIIAFIILGKKFALSTVACTFAYPILLKLLNRIFGEVVLTDDLLLCVVFSGIGIGLSLGIVIRAGASTGGMDIPPLILNKYFKISVSKSLYVFDVLILLGQIYGNSIDKVLYSIIMIMIYTIVLEKLLLHGTSRTEVKIVSKKCDEIKHAILKEMDRGVAMVTAQTGYLQRDTQMVFSVISNRELARLEAIVHRIDENSFMVVSSVKEVRGRGFTKKKEYREDVTL